MVICFVHSSLLIQRKWTYFGLNEWLSFLCVHHLHHLFNLFIISSLLSCVTNRTLPTSFVSLIWGITSLPLFEFKMKEIPQKDLRLEQIHWSISPFLVIHRFVYNNCIAFSQNPCALSSYVSTTKDSLSLFPSLLQYPPSHLSFQVLFRFCSSLSSSFVFVSCSKSFSFLLHSHIPSDSCTFFFLFFYPFVSFFLPPFILLTHFILFS